MRGIQIAYDLGRERRANTELEERRRSLTIEIGMLKDPGRIIGVAHDQLHMGPPAPADVVKLGWPGAWCCHEEGRVISTGRWTRVRMAVCGTAFAALFFAVGKRAYNLQVRDAERLRAMAEEQYLREIELPPRRGRILDRNGADLASTADVDSIYCNPRQLPDPREAARRLALVLGLDRGDLEKKLRSGASSRGSSAGSRPRKRPPCARCSCRASR